MSYAIFGKVPESAEFVREGADPELLELIESWLHSTWQGVLAVRGDSYRQEYVNSPIWAFAAPLPGIRNYAVGLLVPSLDAVGRYHPLMVCTQTAATDAVAALRGLSDWVGRVEEALLRALSPDSIGFADLVREAAQAQSGPEHIDVAWRHMRSGAGEFLFRTGVMAASDVLHEFAGHTAPEYSFWEARMLPGAAGRRYSCISWPLPSLLGRLLCGEFAFDRVELHRPLGVRIERRLELAVDRRFEARELGQGILSSQGRLHVLQGRYGFCVLDAVGNLPEALACDLVEALRAPLLPGHGLTAMLEAADELLSAWCYCRSDGDRWTLQLHGSRLGLRLQAGVESVTLELPEGLLAGGQTGLVLPDFSRVDVLNLAHEAASERSGGIGGLIDQVRRGRSERRAQAPVLLSATLVS